MINSIIIYDIIVIPKGQYHVDKDLYFPKNSKVTLEAGTTIYLGQRKGILIRGELHVNGNKKNPVIITSKVKSKPFGSIAVLGSESQTETSEIQYLQLSGGSEKWLEGAFFSGGISFHYNDKVIIENSVFTHNMADDALNIKYAEVKINNNLFKDNYADQVDLDYCTGVVKDSKFINLESSDINGDGLDISGSEIIVDRVIFKGFKDKGISIGEKSKLFVSNSIFSENTSALAIKDESDAYLWGNTFLDNNLDINVYQKKKIFGGGKAYASYAKRHTLKIELDKKSEFKVFPQDLEIKKNKILFLRSFSPKAVFSELESIPVH